MQKWNGQENTRSFNKTPLTITSCALICESVLLPFATLAGISGSERHKYNAEQQQQQKKKTGKRLFTGALSVFHL